MSVNFVRFRKLKIGDCITLIVPLAEVVTE